MSQSANNKRIAKNTFFLYIRMVFLIIVNLYTSRVVINALGLEDYGLYSVVGAVVIFLGFLNNSMTAAAQRFLSYSKGKEDLNRTKSIFNSLFAVQIIVAGIILILAETLGIIYIEKFLNVSPTKLYIAHYVYQFSLLSLLTKVVTVPYTASIIANERMRAFALISILEGMLQLSVALILPFIMYHRLIWYALLMFLTVFIIQLGYRFYSWYHFSECRINFSWKRDEIKSIIGYSGWNLLGALSSVATDQGVNMVLNSFFGVVVNAARGIAFQVSAAVASLSGNFQQAINPQIVKNYASGNLDEMYKIITKGTKFTFYLLLVIEIPFIFNMYSVLSIWLGVVPDYAVFFCQLVLVNAMFTACSGSLLIGAMATGKIKKYQIIVASINLLNLPLSYIGLVIYPNPYLTMYIMIGLSSIAFITRLLLVSNMIKLSKRFFIKNAIMPVLKVCILTITILYFTYSAPPINNKIISLILGMLACFLLTTTIIYIIGMTSTEKKLIKDFIIRKFSKR